MVEWKRKVYLSACSFLNTYALAQIRYKSQLIILLYDTIWIQICFAKHNSRLTYTGRQQSFTPGREPPLVPVPHPGASIRD